MTDGMTDRAPVTGADHAGSSLQPDRTARLPVPLTRLIGRELELGQLYALLDRDDVRMVTLTGPGGVGKTRLAVSAAERHADQASGSVLFVELAPVQDTEAVLPTIADALLGQRSSPDRPALDLLVDAIGQRGLLLVLDNLEHLVEAAPAIAALLSACRDITVLATSREPLRISGEHALSVPALSLPSGLAASEQLTASEAVRLFIARAEAAGTVLNIEENAGLIVEICRRLDCLPLAIELAAARLRHIALPELLQRLERPLPLLTGGVRDQPTRHRTLRNAITWSYDLLEPAEQILFRRLSVFNGGFSVEAVEEICAPLPGEPDAGAFDLLASLTDRSLVQPDTAPGRFRMLETLREFAAELLAGSDERDIIRRRHVAWFVCLAERAEMEFWSDQHDAWLHLLEVEHPNFRAAMGYALEESDVVPALRIASALAPLWWLLGHQREGRRWLQRVTFKNDPTIGCRDLAKAFHVAARLAAEQGDYAEAKRLAQRCIEEADGTDIQAELEAEAYLALGVVDSYLGNIDEARARLEAAEAVFREINSLGCLGWTLCHLGTVESLATEHAQSDGLDRADARSRESEAIFDQLGLTSGLARALQGQAYAALLRHDIEGALRESHRAMAILQRINDRWSITPCLEDCGRITALRGDSDTAVQLYSAAARLREELGTPIAPVFRPGFDRALDQARRQLGSVAFDAAWKRGQAISLDEAAELALEVTAEPSPATHASGRSTSDQTRLTEREQEVLRLVADGMTNPAIADALFISPATARVHVSNILGKLGARTRTEAVAVARRQALL